VYINLPSCSEEGVVSNQVCAFSSFSSPSRAPSCLALGTRFRHCGSAVRTTRTDVPPVVLLCTPSSLISLPSQPRTTSLSSRPKLRSTMLKMLTAIHSTESEMKIYIRFCTGWITRASYISFHERVTSSSCHLIRGYSIGVVSPYPSSSLMLK
jgi:hypothetical protein